MTDNTSDKPQEDRARPAPVLTTPATKRTTETSSTQPAGKDARRGQSPLTLAALALALAALGFGVMTWQRQKAIQAAYDDLSRQLASSSAEFGQTDTRVQALTAQVTQHGERLTALTEELESANNIIRDLDEALRLMTDRGSELVLLNDVDHLATIAQQQLELGGNVRNAIVALESAQAQLARANRPAFASLLQTVNGDLDRLRAASTIDVAAFSQQLEELALLLSDAPLIVPDKASAASDEAPVHREQPAPTVPPSAESRADTWWEQALSTSREWSRDAWNAIRRDLGDFIDVRRVDDASALLMSPDQAARFRDSLRTRIMTAQLALMMRQVEVWRTEMAAIVKAIETRYDQNSSLTRRALRLASNMAEAPIDAQLPSVANTLQALQTLRDEQGREFRDSDASSEETATEPTAQDEPGQDAQSSKGPEETPDSQQASTESTPDQNADMVSPASAAPSAQPRTGD